MSRRRKWTVAVWVAGDNNLESFGETDLGEMKSVGSTDDVAVVAQFDRMGDVGRLLQAYRDDPFDPHAIAAMRPGAYRRAVVMAYIDNLLDWGDMLFRQYTGESIDEACINALYMERTAKILAIAGLHGYQGPTPDAIETLTASRKKLFRRPRDEMFHSADWNYYADKVRRGERWTRGWT